MKSLRDTLHCNNYHNIGSKNLDRTIENNIRKLTIVCLPYVKGLAKKIQKICSPYDIRKIFRSSTILQKYFFHFKPSTEHIMTKNNVYSILCGWGKVYEVYKGEKCRPLKVRLEQHRKAGYQVEVEKLGMADHI